MNYKHNNDLDNIIKYQYIDDSINITSSDYESYLNTSNFVTLEKGFVYLIMVGANSNISVDEFISSIIYFDGIEGKDYLRLTHTEGKGKMQGGGGITGFYLVQVYNNINIYGRTYCYYQSSYITYLNVAAFRIKSL